MAILKKHIALGVLAFFLFLSFVSAQTPGSLIWTQTNNPSANDDGAYGVAVDSSGVYVVGYDTSSTSEQWRIEKRSLSTGSLIWNHTNNLSIHSARAYGVAVDSSGVYVVGYDTSSGSFKPRIEKRSLSTGSLIWTYSNNQSGGVDIVYGVAVDSSGVYVVGFDSSSTSDQWKIEKRSLSTGSLIWTQVSNPSINSERAYGVAVDSSGVYVVGYDYLTGNINWRIEKRSLSTGSLIWTQRSSPSIGVDIAYGVAVDSSGVYVVGQDASSSFLKWRIEKRNLTNGTLIWTQVSSLSGGGIAYGVAVDSSGVYVVGRGYLTGNSQWLIEKRNLTNGTLIWTQANNPSSLDDSINSVAVDSSGVYLGGYDSSPGNSQWRIEKRVANPPPPPTTPPIILVHGYHGTPTGTWQTMKTRLQQDGFTVFETDLAPGIPSANGDIVNYANILKNHIQQVKTQTGASQVDLVVHSMGGLVSRWYIQQPGYQGDVRRLIMLGTPNHGSEIFPIAYAIFINANFVPAWLGQSMGIGSGGIVALGTAGTQMSPNSCFLNSLNYNNCYTSQGTDVISSLVQYHTIAGTKPFSITNQFLPGDDDGWVTVGSVSLDSVAGNTFFVTHSELHENLTVYNLVKDAILAENLPTDEMPQNVTSPFPLIDFETNSVAPSATKNYSLQIDSTISQAMIMLSWNLGLLNLTMTSPSGQPFNSSSPSYFFDQNSSTQGFFLQSPANGTWALAVKGTNILSPANYTLFSFGNTTLRLDASTNVSSISPGGSILINASLFNGNTPIINGNVSATIIRPNNNKNIIALFDDGLHNDGAANDGRYANTYTNTSQAGTYTTTIKARGSFAGGFSRTHIILFSVELLPDLKIQSSDIIFNPPQLTPGQNKTINVSATIRNVGERLAENISVQFYRGNPTSGGTLFGNSTINILQINSSVVINAQLNRTFNSQPSLNIEGNTTRGVFVNVSISEPAFKHENIYVVLGSLSGFIESNYSNNIANKTLTFPPINYMIGLSLGTSPGTNLSDGRVIPLNPDTLLIVSVFSQYWPMLAISNFQGLLDSQGRAKGSMIIPNVTGASGLMFYTGFITLNTTGIVGSISPAINSTII